MVYLQNFNLLNLFETSVLNKNVVDNFQRVMYD